MGNVETSTSVLGEAQHSAVWELLPSQAVHKDFTLTFLLPIKTISQSLCFPRPLSHSLIRPFNSVQDSTRG